jgi:3-oxoacyl-[acyl-carrier-protein] synthase-3
MSAYIKGIAYYLPEKVLTNDDLTKIFPEWTVNKVSSKLGISERHIAASDETALDMSVKASVKLFTEYKISPSEIDFILFCTQSPDYILPTSACIIQDRLGIPTSAGALDFNLGCSGYIYGLSLAKGLIMGEIANNVLLLTSETYSKYLDSDDKSNKAIFGDASTATLVSRNGFAKILNFNLGTDGKGAENLIIKTGGSKYKDKKEDVHYEGGNPISSDYLYMNGPEIFSFTIESVPLLVKNTLLINRIMLEEIDLFIFHQANKYILDFLRRKIGIEEDKFFYYLEKVGNTVSSSIPIALKEAQKGNKLKSKVLLAGFGVGYSWAGTVLTVTN